MLQQRKKYPDTLKIVVHKKLVMQQKKSTENLQNVQENYNISKIVVQQKSCYATIFRSLQQKTRVVEKSTRKKSKKNCTMWGQYLVVARENLYTI